MTYEDHTNWGRWGPNDERGTANLLTDDVIRAAASLVRRGKVYSLAVPLEPDGPIESSRSPLWHRTSFYVREDAVRSGSADDMILMHTHGTTHIDALCHAFYGAELYNGFPLEANISSRVGATRNGIHNVSSLVGRGVLLDLPRFRQVEHLERSEVLDVEELDACAAAQGVGLRPGDIVLIRTGWIKMFAKDRQAHDQGAPGPNASATEWFHRHDLCALGADTVAVERYPFVLEGNMSLHLTVIRNLGGYLLEFLYLEELAQAQIYEFMFVAAPLRLVNGIGSPLNPLAIV